MIELAKAGRTLTYADKVLGYSPIAYWQLNEAAGTIAACSVNGAQSGNYVGVTLGQTGIGDGETCPLFDGTNDYVDTYSATLDAKFDGDEGSFMCWVKVNTGVWTDGVNRYPILFGEDNTNRIYLVKLAANNTLEYTRKADDNLDDLHSLTSFSLTTWFQALITWSIAGTAQATYINGVETAVSPTVIANNYVGNLTAGWTCIGAKTIPPEALDGLWSGWLAHCAIWDSVLTPAQIADLAVI